MIEANLILWCLSSGNLDGTLTRHAIHAVILRVMSGRFWPPNCSRHAEAGIPTEEDPIIVLEKPRLHYFKSTPVDITIRVFQGIR